MGELVQSTEIEIELEKNPETETAKLAGNKSRKMNSTAGGGAAASRNSGSVVRWERFLPNMAMRVLLVEADDSTRQIVGALLRKCSYKVAAASDGLKAWELIKSRPHSIDLILTEVELPSISGYALLTLIMENDICKNIPVIMMSSHDSVSTVYNCMLRGAADFLVKPLRKNELRNLWQHVWRKQTSSASGPGPPEDSLAQQIIEATAENNDVSNHSSGNMACLKRNREFIERGSDAQSSCTKPELAVEEAKCISDDVIIYTQDECTQEHAKTRALNNNGTTQKHDNNSDDGLLVNVISQNSDSNNNAPGNSSREAIDLIGPFDNYLKGSFRVPISNASMNKFDSLPPLDLSLKRFKPSCSVNQVNDERRRLNHSDASAFSRYINSPLQPQNSTSPSTCNQQQENHETNPEKQLSNHTPDRNSDRISSQKHISGPTFSHPEPIPVKRVRIENVMNGCVSMIPQMYPPHSGPSPLSSPGIINNLQFYPQLHSLYPSDVQPSSSQQFYIIDQMDSQKMENLEDESGSSNFYTNPVSDRSLQRIVALSKFRQKRKDRCFVKKVRYEGRKKLAEQRPRVKGQFVRHLPNSPQLGSSSDD